MDLTVFHLHNVQRYSRLGRMQLFFFFNACTSMEDVSKVIGDQVCMLGDIRDYMYMCWVMAEGRDRASMGLSFNGDLF